MKKNYKDPLEPRVYLPSESHQDYSKEESDYSNRHVVEWFIGKNQSNWDKHLGASYLLDQIVQGLQKHRGRFESFSEEKDKFVIEALKLFGEPFGGVLTRTRCNFQRKIRN